MSNSLLTTKLYFPPARPNLDQRPRLVERLNAGLKKPLTLISAPAGYWQDFPDERVAYGDWIQDIRCVVVTP